MSGNPKSTWTVAEVATVVMIIYLNALYTERARILALANEASVLGDKYDDNGPIIELDRLTEIVNRTGDFAA